MVWPGIGVGRNLERRIFLHQLGDRHAQLFLIGLGLGLDGELNHRRREIDIFQNHRSLLVANGVAGRNRLQPHRRADIARQNFGDFFALVGVHLDQTPDALPAALGDVVNRIARAQPARIDANERQLPDKRVGHDLEHQRRKRLAVARLALDDLFRIVHVGALHRRNVERRRQVIHHRVQQVLHALVLERRPADHRENLLRDGRLADAGAQLVVGNRLAFDELREQVIVGFRHRLDQLVVIFLGLRLQDPRESPRRRTWRPASHRATRARSC